MEAEERPSKVPRLDAGPVVATATAATDPPATEADAESRPPPPPSTGSSSSSSDAIITTDAIATTDPISTADATATADAEPPLSKSAQRRLRRRAAWDAAREERKAKRKVKRVEQRERRKQEKQERRDARNRGVRDAGDAGDAAEKRRRRPTPARPLPVALVLDCGFDDLMLDKEIVSLTSQITRCYSDVHRAGSRSAKLVVTDFDRRLKDRFETVLKNNNHRNWKGVEVFEDSLDVALTKIAFPPASVAHARTQQIWTEAELQLALQAEGNAAADAATDVKAPLEAGTTLVADASTAPIAEARANGSSSTTTDHSPAAISIAATETNLNSSPSSPQLPASAPSALPAPPTTAPAPASLTTPAQHTASQPLSIPLQRTVYLTADSPNTLHQLEPYTAYVIGALVDRNRHKNVCLKRAEQLGLPHARLPIAEFLAMRARKVLATNHVVEILLGWLENKDWGSALLRGVPPRTGAVRKDEHDTGGNGTEGADCKDGKGKGDTGDNESEGEGEDDNEDNDARGHESRNETADKGEEGSIAGTAEQLP